MREVSCRVTRVLDSFASRLGIRLEELAGDLPVAFDQLRDPEQRMDWDVFATLVERCGERFGMERAEELGSGVLQEAELAGPLKLLGRAVVSPKSMYLAACSWLAPSWFWNMQTESRELGPDRIEIVVKIPDTYRAAPWYFRHVTGMLRVAPTVLGLPEADVVAETTGHGGRWLIVVPRASLRGKLSLLPRMFSAYALADELGRQQQSLNAAFMDNLRAAEAQRNADRRFQALLGGVVEIIAVVDATGTLSYANRSVEAALGYSVEEMIGSAAFAYIHPDDIEVARETFRVLSERPGAVSDVSLRCRAKNGVWVDFDVTLRNLQDDPEIRGFVVNARNVTERRRAEAALREREREYSTLLANVRGMVYRCRNDEAWTMELVSDGCERVTGFRPDELLNNAVVAFGDLILPDDQAPLWAKCQANLDARRQCSNEYRIRTKTGEIRWVWDLAHGIWDDAGQLLAIEGLVTDITERRRLEEQLLQAQKMDGIGRLAGGIAHDFNNLLAVMLGYVGLALKELPADHPARAHIEPIADAGRRASDLTRQLLTFARRQVIEPRVIDANEVIDGISSLLGRVLGDHIELGVRLMPENAVVRADAAQLEQVLMNLAINARDAMPDGGQLSIESSRAWVDDAEARQHPDRTPGPHVVITVSDTGTGLTAEARAHLFEPFFTTKAVGHGTGLGLATSYGIVKQAGGHIRVRSEDGRGTTFEIYLPSAGEAARPREVVESVPSAAGGETILVVEDHDLVRSLITRSLAAIGYDVLAADDGPAALSLAAEHSGPIHLLLTDVTMPRMSGPELARELTRSRPALRVLFTSGFADSAVAPEGVLDTGVLFLAKPFTMTTLVDKVQEALASG